MSSFFTTPSAKKRKSATSGGDRSTTKRSKNGDQPSKITRTVSKKKKSIADEDISSESENERRDALTDEEGEDTEDEFANETPAERRRRLAQQYLDNLKAEAEQETVGFDAEDVDREIIAARLKEGVAEQKGRIYRRLASNYNFSDPISANFAFNGKTTTGIAVCAPYFYTVSKGKSLVKWEIPTPREDGTMPKPKIVAKAWGKSKDNVETEGHVREILCVAASSSGKFVATGGKDNRLVVWDAETLKPLKVFKQHRGSVTGLVFRRNTNQLYSCSSDRTCKVWSLDELAYLETLFGHQDEVLDITALAAERCVTVGARDRTARLWKIVDETQLVFRGGGESKKRQVGFVEGSMDCVTMIDEEHFVTGSDNGSISLWSINKKKPIHTIPVAHGLNPPLNPADYSAEVDPPSEAPAPPQPRLITSLAAVPYSDLFMSGSTDGFVRVWKISEDKKKIEAVGRLGVEEKKPDEDGMDLDEPEVVKSAVDGIVNGIDIVDVGEKGREELVVVVATGKEMRLGSHLKMSGRNGGMVFRVKKKQLVDRPEINGHSE